MRNSSETGIFEYGGLRYKYEIANIIDIWSLDIDYVPPPLDDFLAEYQSMKLNMAQTREGKKKEILAKALAYQKAQDDYLNQRKPEEEDEREEKEKQINIAIRTLILNKLISITVIEDDSNIEIVPETIWQLDDRVRDQLYHHICGGYTDFAKQMNVLWNKMKDKKAQLLNLGFICEKFGQRPSDVMKGSLLDYYVDFSIGSALNSEEIKSINEQ